VNKPSVPLILLEVFAGMGALAVVLSFIVENFNGI
jgi:hypothetical protein